MAEVMRHYEGTLDWGAFTDRANRWRVANGARMALRLAEEWTGLRCGGGMAQAGWPGAG